MRNGNMNIFTIVDSKTCNMICPEWGMHFTLCNNAYGYVFSFMNSDSHIQATEPKYAFVVGEGWEWITRRGEIRVSFNFKCGITISTTLFTTILTTGCTKCNLFQCQRMSVWGGKSKPKSVRKICKFNVIWVVYAQLQSNSGFVYADVIIIWGNFIARCRAKGVCTKWSNKHGNLCP